VTSLAARNIGSIEPYLHKEIPMKRSALAGLFITAAMLASPVFAADNLCEANLSRIKSGEQLTAATSRGDDGGIKGDIQRAEAAHAAGDDKLCIEITTKTIQDLQNTDKGGNQ